MAGAGERGNSGTNVTAAKSRPPHPEIPRPGLFRKPNTIWLLSSFLCLVVGVAVLIRVAPGPTDITLDKYTAQAAWDGTGSEANQSELLRRYGDGTFGFEAPHPRSPAAVLFQTPLLAVADRFLVWVMLPLVVGGLVATFWSAAKIGKVGGVAGAIGLGLFSLTGLYHETVVWANVTMVVTPLIVVAWIMMDRRPQVAGVLFGAATAFKLWPAIVVAVLLARRDTRRMGFMAAVVAASLTAAGLLLPGVSVEGTVKAMQEAAAFFGALEANLSLSRQGGMPGLLIGIGVVVLGLAGSLNTRVATALTGGLLLSPIVWWSYWLALLPVAAFGLAQAKTYLFAHTHSPATRFRVRIPQSRKGPLTGGTIPRTGSAIASE